MSTKMNDKKHDNELANVLEKALPFFEKYGNTLLLAVAAVLALAALFIYMGKLGGEEEIGWADMSAATSTEDYAGIAERFPGTSVGKWAKLIEADSYLQSAVKLSFIDRESSKNELKTATEKYDALLAMDIPDNIKEKALFGSAKCVETGCEGDTSAAIAAYKKLLSEFPDSVYKDVAERRIADLSSEETQDFYAFWGTQDPKPTDRIAPRDGGAAPIRAELPQTPLLLQQPGFNSAAEPELPNFTPGEDADSKPIDPEMVPGSESSEATGDPAPTGTRPVEETGATSGEATTPETGSVPAEGTTPTEGTAPVEAKTEPAAEAGTTTVEPVTPGGQPVETPGQSTPKPATEGSSESK